MKSISKKFLTFSILGGLIGVLMGSIHEQLSEKLNILDENLRISEPTKSNTPSVAAPLSRKHRPIRNSKAPEVNSHSDSIESFRQRPHNKRVEFKIVEGYAVAYGDILLGKPDRPVPDGNGITEPSPPLPWEHTQIAYSISPDLPHPERIEKALNYLRQKTPVNFVPFNGQRDAILFETAAEHCLSYLGRIEGVQPIKLSPQCQWQDVLHEILHSLGIVHEQSRSDRDQYVDILWENIEENYRDQFAIAPDSFLEPVRHFPFDYHSVMLYRTDSFTIQRDLPNMRSKGSELITPTEEGLSEGDIRRLNRIFRGYE